MSLLRRPGTLIALVLTAVTLAACSEASSPAGLSPRASASLDKGSSSSSVRTKEVRLLDDCDSVSFNQNIGPGACTKRGSVTFDRMIADLTKTKDVGAWWINPDNFNEKPGVSLDVVNAGGETHTFTRVANYGGGFVPLLNDLSGNTAVAPECANIDPATIVASGGHYHTAQLAAGTYKFQCCIHPWMRSTATIRN
jgi:plastocyanin